MISEAAGDLGMKSGTSYVTGGQLTDSGIPKVVLVIAM